MSSKIQRHVKTPSTATAKSKSVYFLESGPYMLGKGGSDLRKSQNAQFSAYEQRFVDGDQNPLTEVLAKFSQPPPTWQENRIRDTDVCLSFADVTDIIKQKSYHAYDEAHNEKAESRDAFAQDLDENRQQTYKIVALGCGRQNAYSPHNLAVQGSLNEELFSQRYGDALDEAIGTGYSSFPSEMDVDDTTHSMLYAERCVLALSSRDYEVQHRYGDWGFSFTNYNLEITADDHKIMLADFDQLEKRLEQRRTRLRQFSACKDAAELQLREDDELMYKQLEIAEMAEVVACAQEIKRCRAARNLKECIASILAQQ